MLFTHNKIILITIKIKDMKTLNTLILALTLIVFTTTAQNNLTEQNKEDFVKYSPKNNPTTLSNWDDMFGEYNEYKNKILPLVIDSKHIDHVLENKGESLDIVLPFFNNSELELELVKKEIALDGFQLVTQNENGVFTRDNYQPGFVSYKIESGDPMVSGIITYYKGRVQAVIKNGTEVFELTRIDPKRENNLPGNLYMLVNVADSPFETPLVCTAEMLDEDHGIHELMEDDHDHGMRTGGNVCVNVAVEIDYFTRSTFSSSDDAVDWALGILTAVGEIYEEEVNISIVSDYAFVWETEDPYNSYVEQSTDMLYSIKNKWNDDENFESVNRDLVHLFTKRTNTGTGGIAFVNGAGNTNYGFGFSSSLTSDMEYADVPAPFYHWNLLVVSHEIGHNFGSMHTQWCGWSGGPLSNCVDLEESVPGECDPYVNNPAPSIGTIMSYCHTWSQSQGGGITMKFEQQVKDVIMNKAISMQLDVCEDEDQENEQIVAGCIDEIACNYNSLANQSDGSCTYSEEYYDCDGHCISDIDNDGICDELDNCVNEWNADQTDLNENGVGDRCEDFLPLEELEELALVKMFPNPSEGIINITFNNNQAKDINVSIYNIVGNRIACGYPDIFDDKITFDLSTEAKGLYTVVLTTDNQVITKPIVLR